MSQWWENDPVEGTNNWWASDPMEGAPVAPVIPMPRPDHVGSVPPNVPAAAPAILSPLSPPVGAAAPSYSSIPDAPLSNLWNTQVPVPSKPDMPPAPMAAPSPFDGESFGDLLTRRGQQAAAGAADFIASQPEAAAVSAANLEGNVEQNLLENIEGLKVRKAELEAVIQQMPADSPFREKALGNLVETNAQLAAYYDQAKVFMENPTVPAEERRSFQMGDQLRDFSAETFGEADPRDTSFWGKVATGAGSFAGNIAATLAGGLVAGPAGALAAGGATGARANSAQIYKEARSFGADEETAQNAAKLGGLVGASEVLPIFRALEFLPPRLRGQVTNRIVKKVGDVLQSAGEEAAQEALAQIANNAIAIGQGYDPDRSYTEGAGEAALIGGILGGTLGAVVPSGESATKPPEVQEPTPQAPAPPPDPLMDAIRLLQTPQEDRPVARPEQVSMPPQPVTATVEQPMTAEVTAPPPPTPQPPTPSRVPQRVEAPQQAEETAVAEPTQTVELTEPVMEQMRRIGEEAQSAARTRPGTSIEVGGADRDAMLRSEALNAFLRYMRESGDPFVAAEAAQAEMAQMIERQNSERPSDINWQRSPNAYETLIWDRARRVARAAEPMPEAPVPATQNIGQEVQGKPPARTAVETPTVSQGQPGRTVMPSSYTGAKSEGFVFKRESQKSGPNVTDYRVTITGPDGQEYRTSVAVPKGEKFVASRDYTKAIRQVSRPQATGNEALKQEPTNDRTGRADSPEGRDTGDAAPRRDDTVEPGSDRRGVEAGVGNRVDDDGRDDAPDVVASDLGDLKLRSYEINGRPHQEITLPSGEKITRGIDTLGNEYWEGEVDARGAQEAIARVEEILGQLQDRGGTRDAAPQQIEKKAPKSESLEDAADYGPKPGRRPPGRLSPKFVKFSFNNRPSVYNAAFEDAGVDPDIARRKDLNWQVDTLKRIFTERYGIEVEIGTKKVMRKNLLGRRVEGQSLDLQMRKAIDQLLDAYQTIEMMASILNVPTKALALELDGKPIVLNLTSTKRLRGALGMFSYGGGKRMIHMPGRSNSFAHEWAHALDHYLNTVVGKSKIPVIEDQGMLTRRADEQGIVQPLSKLRPVTEAFAYMMNALYGDRARLAQLQLQLQAESTQLDPQGNPTPKAKKAQKALEDLKGGKRPPSEYLNAYFKSSKEFDEAFQAGGYFTDPAEMFARAFETWVGRTVAKETDAPANFISKGTWAYESDADARTAMTFPKGVDADAFGAAMMELSRAMSATSTVEPGEGPVFPKRPSQVEPMLIKRPPEEGNWLGRWAKAEQQRVFGVVDKAFRAVNPRNWGNQEAAQIEESVARAFMRQVINSASGALHDVARNYDGEARKAIDNIARRIGTRPGYGQYTGDVWQQEMEAYALNKIALLRNEVKKVWSDGEVPVKFRRQLRHALMGKESVDGVPIPTMVQKLADRMNRITDGIWYDMDSAGIQLGYQRGYMPFIYHRGLIDADQEGFIKKAKDVYRLMYDREVIAETDQETIEQHIRDTIRQVSGDYDPKWTGEKETLNRLTADDEALIDAWKKARSKVKDLARRAKKASQKGDEDKAAELIGQMEEQQEVMDELQAQVLEALKERWAEYSADHWFVASAVGQVNDFDTMGPSANFLQARRFPPEAADILEDYMVADPLDLMTGYSFAASRKLHYAKAFGAPVMTEDGEAIGADLKTMLQAAAKNGVTKEDIYTIKLAVNAATGRLRGDVNGWVRAVSKINAYGQMALLTLAPLSSFAEPLTVGMRTGSVRDSGKAIISNLRNLIQKGRREELYDLAQYIGLVSDYTAETIMNNRMSMDAMAISDKDRMRVAKFHQMTMLTPLTNFNRVANLPVANGVLIRLLRHSVRGERTATNAVRDRIAGGRGQFAHQELNELGIAEAEREPLLDWLESLKGMPRQEDLLAPDGSLHNAARIWSRAVRRMTNETIQNTMKSDRAMAANSPYLASMYSIMSFIDGFHRNILLRGLRRGVSEDAGIVSWERMWKGGANVGLMAAPAMMLFAGQVLTTIFRETILNADKLEEMDDDEYWEYILKRGFSRTGFTGRFDPLYQLAHGVKYENDLTGMVAGPYNSFYGGQLQTILEAVYGRNSENTNTAEWNAAQAFYRGVVHPMGATAVVSLFPSAGIVGALGKSSLYYLGRYDTSREFADGLVGEKGTNYKKENMETPWFEVGGLVE